MCIYKFQNYILWDHEMNTCFKKKNVRWKVSITLYPGNILVHTLRDTYFIKEGWMWGEREEEAILHQALLN